LAITITLWSDKESLDAANLQELDVSEWTVIEKFQRKARSF